ncbi:MAG TPA: HD domain-containing phosphohydrolase [Rhodocyclaceae bacterium]
MKLELNVSLNQFVFSLSQALDLINPSMADHHKRVAYVALRIAEAMGIAGREKEDLVIAAALHDVGQLPDQCGGADHALSSACSLRGPHFGFQLLRKFKPFEGAAGIVRFHCLTWADGTNDGAQQARVPVGSHIVHLANLLDGLIDRQRPVRCQAAALCAQIATQRGTVLMPRAVDAFLKVSANDAFWLDLDSPNLLAIIEERMLFSSIELDIDGMQDFAELLAQMIDFRSRFTATHSAAVAATAATLAQLMGFPGADCRRIQIAGCLHDLGKVAVPSSCLDKPGKLNDEEWLLVRSHPYYTYRILAPIRGLQDIARWSGYHHERLCGGGYPFGGDTSVIPLEARVLSLADVFTALTEDRPYRKGLEKDAVLDIMARMVEAFEVDHNVFRVLVDHYADVDRVRRAAQETAAREYRSFMDGLAVLDLSGARAAHVAWKQRLRSYLDGQGPLERERMVSHRECDLGRWYHGDGLLHYGHIAELRDLEAPHRELHELIGTLVEHKESGRGEEAERCYAQVEPISRRIVGLLNAIEHKAARATEARRA